MNFTDNEYFLPIFIGMVKENIGAARTIRKMTGIRAHFFADSFPLIHKMVWYCHKVAPMRDDFLAKSLIDFKDSIEEYFCPVIVICESRAAAISDRIAAKVESDYIIIEFEKLNLLNN